MGTSQALPTTSYIKLVDIWMIFTMVIPFIEVVVHSYTWALQSRLTGGGG